MFTHLVVLYIAFILDLPKWCKVMMLSTLVVDGAKFLFESYKAGVNAGEQGGV